MARTLATLLREARDHIARAESQRQWDCPARQSTWEAGELLRAAGLPDIAEKCEDVFGCDFETVLGEIEREIAP